MKRTLDGTHIGEDEHGCATIEWWHVDRKLTLYTVSSPFEALIKTCGLTGDTEFVPVLDALAVRKAFQWLEDAEREKK